MESKKKVLSRSAYWYFAFIHQLFVVYIVATLSFFGLAYLLFLTGIPIALLELILGRLTYFIIPLITLIFVTLISRYCALWIRGRYTFEDYNGYLLFCTGYVALYIGVWAYFSSGSYPFYLLVPLGSLAVTWATLRKTQLPIKARLLGGASAEEEYKHKKKKRILGIFILIIVGIFVVLLFIIFQNTSTSKERTQLSCTGFDIVVEEEIIPHFEYTEYNIKLYYRAAGKEKLIDEIGNNPLYTAIPPSETPTILKIIDQPLDNPLGLYIKPSEFSQYEFNQIAGCIEAKHEEFMNLIGQTEPFKDYYNLGYDLDSFGVAELIHSDKPLFEFICEGPIIQDSLMGIIVSEKIFVGPSGSVDKEELFEDGGIGTKYVAKLEQRDEGYLLTILHGLSDEESKFFDKCRNKDDKSVREFYNVQREEFEPFLPFLCDPGERIGIRRRGERSESGYQWEIGYQKVDNEGVWSWRRIGMMINHVVYFEGTEEESQLLSKCRLNGGYGENFLEYHNISFAQN